MKNKAVQKVDLHAGDRKVSVLHYGNDDDFISLTDIAKYKSEDNAFIIINNWLRTKDTIQFLGLWEKLHNPDFKPIEFDRFRNEAGANAFTLSPQQWINATRAIGITSRSGRYGGTYAHKDIAFEFASWVSVEFKLYIIKDYQRLKQDENSRLSLSWNLKRELAKINYRIHTDAVKSHLIPADLSAQQQSFTYANEADVLNVALFGQTAKQWRTGNSDKKGNIRDDASHHQLIVLANLESMNAELIKQGLSQNERALTLNRMAIEQLTLLVRTDEGKQIGE